MSNLYQRQQTVNAGKLGFVLLAQDCYDSLVSLKQSDALVLLWLTAVNRSQYVAQERHKKSMAAGRKAIKRTRKRTPRDIKSEASFAYFAYNYESRSENKPVTLQWPNVSTILEEMGRVTDTRARERLRQSLTTLYGKGHLDHLLLPKRGLVTVKLAEQWANSEQDLYIPLPHPLSLRSELVVGLLMQGAAHSWFGKYPKTDLDPVALAQACGSPGGRIIGRPKRAIQLLQSAIHEINERWPQHPLCLQISGKTVALGAKL